MVAIGIIGLGYWGKNILRNLESLIETKAVRFQIKYLCDTFPTCLEVYKSKYNCITDYNIILNDSEISTVFIITPIHTHFKIIMECINAGKNIYVEKPICMSSEELKIIEIKSKEMNKIVYCDYTFTHSDKISNLKNLVLEYGLENIIHIEMIRESFGKTVQVGVIYDLLPHDLSIITTLFNLTLEEIKLLNYEKIYHNDLLVKALLLLQINKINDTNTNANANTNTNTKVSINLSSVNAQKVRIIKIYFKDKIVEYDDTNDIINIFHYYLSRSNNLIVEEKLNNEEKININYKEPLNQSLATFFEIITDTTTNINKYEINWKMNKILTNILEKTM